MIAPSDMMDNRVAAIKAGLIVAGLGGKVYHIHLPHSHVNMSY